MRILVSGAHGHMGREVCALAKDETLFGVDPYKTADCPIPCAESFAQAETNVDCVIDFSNHAATYALLDFAVTNHLPLILATTGQTAEERSAILEASQKIPLFFAANYSLGIAVLIDLAKKTAALFPDAEIEIIEKHHDRKLDAPSGTALAIAEAIKEVHPAVWTHCGRNGQQKRTKEEIGIHAIRMGNIVGEHEVIIGTNNQTITLKHEAHSRALFAEGALSAAKFLIGKAPGLYTMQNLIGD